MDNNLNNLQRVEAGRRLEILGYEKDVCEKYLDGTAADIDWQKLK